MPNAMQFLMVVGDPDIARFVAANGVDRLFVDLEYIGKDVRQKGLDTWKSRQTVEDLTRVREAAPGTHVLVRINPPYEGTAAEVEDVVARGADSVMLPMFRSADDVARFLDLLGGRAEAVPLVETVGALDAIPEMSARLPLTRLHIGLNDLHLELKMRFMFQPLANGLLEHAAATLRQHGIAFGIGGLARAHEGIVSPDILLGEHVRLGSTAAILSRTFHRKASTLAELQAGTDFAAEVKKLRDIHAAFLTASTAELEQNRVTTADRINDVVRLIQRNERNDTIDKP